jgi:AcrR family transcriptional regulator
MPQVRKPDVDTRIRQAALRRFAEHGYEGASMVAIAEAAGVATANIYRYYPDGKSQLFDTVVTDDVAHTHDALIVERVHALVLPLRDDSAATGPAAQQLLDFWVDHRLEVVILLGHTHGTRLAGYGDRFVQLLVELAITRLRDTGADITPTVRHLLDVIFDNTRRALVAILATHHDQHTIRRAVAGFWSYQVPGLDGFSRWVRHADEQG